MKKKIIVGVSVLAILGAGIASGAFFHHATAERVENFCVTDSYRDVVTNETGTTTSKWMVTGRYKGTESFEVFENKDSFYPWKTKSSTLQARLEVYRCYDLEVTGMRVSLFSMYRNIIKAKVNPTSPSPFTMGFPDK